MAAGDFSVSAISQALLRIENIWSVPRDRMVYEAPIETVKTVIEQTTANVSAIVGPQGKNADVRVWWVDAQGLEGTQAIDADCEPDGTELETAAEDYELTITRQAENFKVKIDIEPRDNLVEASEIIAKGLMKQRAELDKYYNRAVLAKLLTFAGTNFLPEGYFEGWVNSGSDIFVDDELWGNADLFMQFLMVTEMNNFSSPQFIHGRNYWLLSQAIALGAIDDEVAARKFGINQHNFDPKTFNALDINDVSIAIDRGAVAFASKAYHPDTPTARPKDRTIFTVNSTIPGMKYDVTTSDVCLPVSGVGEELVRVYTMRGKADVFLNPTIVEGNTGVLVLNKGTAPAGEI